VEVKGLGVGVVNDGEEPTKLYEKVLPSKNMLFNHLSRNKSHPYIFNLEDLSEWPNILSILEV